MASSGHRHHEWASSLLRWSIRNNCKKHITQKVKVNSIYKHMWVHVFHVKTRRGGVQRCLTSSLQQQDSWRRCWPNSSVHSQRAMSWAEREEAPCASDAPLQKKNEELKDVLWGRVISRSSSGSLGVSAVTRYAYSTGSPGVCKFLFLSHIWSCFLRLCLLFRSFKPLWRGGGEPKTFGSCLTQSDETRRGRGGWNYSDSFLSWVFSTREAELESVEDGDG